MQGGEAILGDEDPVVEGVLGTGQGAMRCVSIMDSMCFDVEGNEIECRGYLRLKSDVRSPTP